VEVRSREKTAKKEKKETKYCSAAEKIWSVMNPIWCRMKKCSPSSVQNETGALVAAGSLWP
jgi:hypothetical protein